MMRQITASSSNHQNKALSNAMAANAIDDLAQNYRNTKVTDTYFSIETPKQSIHNQRQSGRCWMYSSFNVLRANFAHRHGDSINVEFSHDYLFFYDQLEKANLMLQGVIDCADKPIDDTRVQFFFHHPINDGGTFCGVADLAEKYGLVPVEAQPETYSAERTSRMSQLVASKLREYGLELRQMVADKKSKKAIGQRKTEMLGTIYSMLSLTLGETTVLLRALGIPARYVSGYVVYAKENTWTEVSGKNAHAWVEYCAGDGRWTLLEPTPETEARASGLSVYLDEGRIERLPQKSEDPDEEDDPDDRTEDEREEQPRQEPEQEDTPGMTETGGRARRSRTWLKALLWAAAGLAAWQAMLRLIRRQTLKRGDPNRRAVAYWRHIRRLARLSGSPVSEEIEQLALKARFSQHEISQEELRFLEERAAALREWLLAGNLVKKIALRLLWGL